MNKDKPRYRAHYQGFTCPVPEGTQVEVIWRQPHSKGIVRTSVCVAPNQWWSRIICYRVLEGELV